MPNIGFWATAGAGSASVPAYELISTTVLSSSTASVYLESIPATYKHLQLRFTLRADTAYTGAATADMSFNTDLPSNYTGLYAHHGLYGTGSSVASYASADASQIRMSNFAPQGGNPSGIYAAGIADILDYASTTKFKTARVLYGAASPNWIQLQSGLYRSTTAINRLNITNPDGRLFVSGSRFSLYGIKG